MTEFTYERIPFQVPVREGFYHYRQEVSPAYLVIDTAIDWASIVVHRKPGKIDNRWFVSEFVTGGAVWHEGVAQTNSLCDKRGGCG